MARAVAAAPVVAEYLVPLLSADGTALLYRGQWSDDDQRQLQRAAALLNTTTETIQVQELPGQRGLRHVIPLRPKGACPKQYPGPWVCPPSCRWLELSAQALDALLTQARLHLPQDSGICCCQGLAASASNNCASLDGISLFRASLKRLALRPGNQWLPLPSKP